MYKNNLDDKILLFQRFDSCRILLIELLRSKEMCEKVLYNKDSIKYKYVELTHSKNIQIFEDIQKKSLDIFNVYNLG
jgi:hypothetical protein